MRLHATLLLPCLLVAATAHAVTQAEAERVASRYIATLPPAEVSYEAVRTVVGDLDGDGTPEILVQKALLGPTYWSYQLEVFVDRGAGYLHVATGDLWGEIESIAIDQGVVVVQSMMPGPDDARCCPTLRKTFRYRWQGGQLIEQK